ncbi:MAG: hypothetical protein ACRD5J_13305 [Nitrososphaeraceae archaeon]
MGLLIPETNILIAEKEMSNRLGVDKLIDDKSAAVLKSLRLDDPTRIVSIILLRVSLFGANDVQS